VPVFESRNKFNLPPRAEDASYVVIVFDLSKGTDIFRIGTIVDKVKDVITIDDNEIKPVPHMSKDFNTEFIHGIFKQKSDFIMLLNVEKVFTSDELLVIKETGLKQTV
jgi:purine-binding chemotaxis protein CheW